MFHQDYVFCSGTSCDYGSAKFFALCGLGGILSCGTTHTALVPLDLVKCRIQVDPGNFVYVRHLSREVANVMHKRQVFSQLRHIIKFINCIEVVCM